MNCSEFILNNYTLMYSRANTYLYRSSNIYDLSDFVQAEDGANPPDAGAVSYIS